jgi:hypothetical protein
MNQERDQVIERVGHAKVLTENLAVGSTSRFSLITRSRMLVLSISVCRCPIDSSFAVKPGLHVHRINKQYSLCAYTGMSERAKDNGRENKPESKLAARRSISDSSTCRGLEPVAMFESKFPYL